MKKLINLSFALGAVLIISGLLFGMVSFPVGAQDTGYPAPGDGYPAPVNPGDGYPAPIYEGYQALIGKDSAPNPTPYDKGGLDVGGFIVLSQPEDQHCPSGWLYKAPEGEGTLPQGLNININGKSVSFNMQAEFCVKAGTGNSGVKSGTGYTVDFENNGGQNPNISYVAIYAVVYPTATPFTPPTNTPEVTPTFTPTNTPTSTLEFTPTNTPTGTLDPTQTPTIVSTTVVPTLPIPPLNTPVFLPQTGREVSGGANVLFNSGLFLMGLGIVLSVIKKKIKQNNRRVKFPSLFPN